MSDDIYAFDPAAVPDSAFEPGDLHHAVVGNHARLLDARRTPLTVIAVHSERAEIEVRVDAFEDQGARWRLPVWEIGRLQFAAGSPRAADSALSDLRAATGRLHRPLRIPADLDARPATLRAITDARHDAGRHLRRGGQRAIDLADCVLRREGPAWVRDALRAFLDERELIDIDARFTQALVSNPWSGETVKGHAIVLAELGLAEFDGTIIRDPDLFTAGAMRTARRAHLIARLAFARELWAMCAAPDTPVFRAAATDAPSLTMSRPRTSFVSCTFSADVAAAHFAGGPTTRAAAVWCQPVPTERLLMTFLETDAMNAQFREAEAVLIGDVSGDEAF